jgi:hypothetical protein
MTTPISKQEFINGKVWCTFFGHHFETSRNVTHHLKEYKCSVCQLELTNDEKGQIVSLTPKHRIINDTLVYFNKKKHHII